MTVSEVLGFRSLLAVVVSGIIQGTSIATALVVMMI